MRRTACALALRRAVAPGRAWLPSTRVAIGPQAEAERRDGWIVVAWLQCHADAFRAVGGQIPERGWRCGRRRGRATAPASPSSAGRNISSLRCRGEVELTEEAACAAGRLSRHSASWDRDVRRAAAASHPPRRQAFECLFQHRSLISSRKGDGLLRGIPRKACPAKAVAGTPASHGTIRVVPPGPRLCGNDDYRSRPALTTTKGPARYPPSEVQAGR